VPNVVVVMFSSGPRPHTEAVATARGADAPFEKRQPVSDVLGAVVIGYSSKPGRDR
jgi:hypothetical protein